MSAFLAAPSPLPHLPTLHLPELLLGQLWAHARATAPHECVGILGGQVTAGGWHAETYAPLPNVAAKPHTHYEADASELIRALRQWRHSGLELVALFHSHPHGPDHPSASDIRQAGYDVPYLIADLRTGSLRAFLLPAGLEIGLYSGDSTLLP